MASSAASCNRNRRRDAVHPASVPVLAAAFRAVRAACVRAAVAATGVAGLAGAPAMAAPQQQSTTPAVADSPTARALFADFLAQSKENPAEAARIARKLLDDYGETLIAVGPEPDGLFRCAQDEIERLLLADAPVLARFRELESRAAERMLDEAGAEETMRRRRLAPAGLEASLRIAEQELVADAPEAALATLARVARHPDLEGRALVSFAALEAIAAARLGLFERRDAAIARLVGAGAPADAAETVRRTAVRPSPEGSTPRTVLASGPAAARPDASWRAVWEVPLERSLYRRLYEDGARGQFGRDPTAASRNIRGNATLMASAPVVVGTIAFVHDGESVRAVDSDSREELWSRTLGTSGAEREVGTVSDLSVVAVDDDALVAFAGHAFSNSRSGGSRVWCLDPRDGSVRWSVELDGLGGRPEFEEFFPSGAPLLTPEAVLLTARRPTQRLEQVDWIVALDRDDGRLLWARSIAGAPGMRAIAGRRHAGMVRDGDAVVVGSPLGAVARVRTSDGSIAWLRRFPVPLREARFASEPWEQGTPVVAAGRVVWITPEEGEVVALDQATGALLETRPIGPGTAWSSPRYLVAAPSEDGTPMVFGIGSDIAAFAAGDLSSRRWLLSERLARDGVQRKGGDNRQGIRGRVTAAGARMLVPGLEDALIVSTGSGTVEAVVPEQQPANALLANDRIVAAGDLSLRVLMPPDRAEQILRERLAQSPGEPSAAIALMVLALRSDRVPIALEAAAQAESAMRQGGCDPALRRELLDLLLGIAERSPEHAPRAFDVAASVADTAEALVRVAFARGDAQRAGGDGAKAVESWRAIAADPRFASTLLPADGIDRSVHAEAIRRIARATARDVELTAAIESGAAARLGALVQAGATMPDLAAAAAAFPRTRAGVEAAIKACAGLEGEAALAILRSCLEDVLVPPARMDLAETLVGALKAQALPSQRASCAARIDRRVAQLLASSGASGRVDPADLRAPRIGSTPGAAIEFRAVVPRFDGMALVSRDPSLAIALLEGALVRLSGPALEPEWRLRLDDRDPLVLWARDRIVAWQNTTSGDTALVIDPLTGVVVYSTPRPSALWVDAQPRNDPAPMRSPSGVPFQPLQVIPHCDGESLVLVRRNGAIARFGVTDDKPDPIVLHVPFDRIYATGLYDGLLVIAGEASASTAPGVARDPSAMPRATVAVFDAATLRPVMQFEALSGVDVRWVFATALGEVFLGTGEAVERWTTGPTGAPRPQFVTTDSDCVVTEAPVLLGGSLLLSSRNDIPTFIPLHEGAPRTIDLATAADILEGTAAGYLSVPEGAIASFRNRLLLFAPSTEMAGADASARGGSLLSFMALEGEVLRASALPAIARAGQVGAVSPGFATVIERFSLRNGLRLEQPAMVVTVEGEPPSRLLVVDGWLLLSSRLGTTAVPLPWGEDPPVSGVDSRP